tara:strand:+ start:1915 stop:3624 length:1710 start_codon:yes stop_codon:yes gene_type:complete
MQKNRAAIYARYSEDKQRESSIDDQVRNCTRWMDHNGMRIVQVYSDKAISGSVRARPGYLQMLEDSATSSFDVLIIDDLSRLSRDDYEMKGVLRKLAWQGIRVIGVTDGYDSSTKGHKIHAGFKGLMNEMFLDDLRERTHRGMSGQAIKGYNCGGRTYGYRNTPIEDPVRKDAYGRPAVIAVEYVIDPVQSEIVQRIYSWYGEGRSYKWIASELNRLRIPSSRASTWAASAIKVILENEMYQGKLVWNRRVWTKHPDTGKRMYRVRPSEEWITHKDLKLRIVSPKVIEQVRARQQANKAVYESSFTAAPAQRYLFSGLMSCGECGGNFVLVSGNRYGCAFNKTRGTDVCTNNRTVSRHIIEHRLLKSIKSLLLDPKSLAKFKKAAVRIIEEHNAQGRADALRSDLISAKRVQSNLLTAIKQGVLTSTTRQAMESVESEIAQLSKQIADAEKWNISGILPRAVERYQNAVSQLEDRLSDCVEPAREILKSLIGERIQIHRKGEHLEARIMNHLQAVLLKSLNNRNDLGGCGGQICNESYRVCLAPRPSDSIPLKYRKGRAQISSNRSKNP